ncbi:MAG: hypothetical protein JWS11_328 [Cypionkella sp.]|nr:hypothetical protein [Cypionkella sp.]
MRAFMPDEDFALASLKDPTKLSDTWVFRCKIRGKHSSFVCKLSTPDDEGRAKIRNQHARLKSTNAAMKQPLLTTPKALAFVETECALIMDDVKGDSLQNLLPQFANITDASAHLKNAGRWIASFQQSTAKPATFDTKPHMNWLLKKLKRHAENLTVIPDYDTFMPHFRQLEQIAAEAQSELCTRCVTHRDFHLGNLIFGRKGVVYGIDFENNKPDDALRDVISFLFAFVMKWRGAPSESAPPIENFQPAAAAFWEGYADSSTSPKVLDFFRKFSALNGWSGLDASNLTDQKRHRLEPLKQLANTSLLPL